MPHIVVKLLAGRSEQLKRRLAEALVRDVTTVLGVGEESVSLAMEDIQPGKWTEQVFEPDIAPNLGRLYKEPGYGP